MSYNFGSYGSTSGGYTPVGLEAVALSTGKDEEGGDGITTSNTKESSHPPIVPKADPVESFVFPFPPAYFVPPDGHVDDADKTPFPSAKMYDLIVFFKLYFRSKSTMLNRFR
jgi:hypothetical protein